MGCGPGAHSKACFHVPWQFPAATKSFAMARAMHTALSYLRELASIVGTQAIATLAVLCVCYHSLLCRALGYTCVYMSEALPSAAADKPARAHAVYDDEETSPFATRFLDPRIPICLIQGLGKHTSVYHLHYHHQQLCIEACKVWLCPHHPIRSVRSVGYNSWLQLWLRQPPSPPAASPSHCT